MTRTDPGHADHMEALGRLAGGVAHELNNILTTILGHTELLLELVPQESPWRPSLHDIQQAGEQAAALTRKLLIIGGRQAAVRDRCELNDVVAASLDLVRHTVGSQVAVEWQPGADPSQILADQAELGQLLVLVAENAGRAMPKGGRLALATSSVSLAGPVTHGAGFVPAGRYLRLTIADSGTGIAGDALPHVLEPYFTTAPRGPHKGLGLALACGIMSQAGGYVGVDSVLGAGTTVSLYFPDTSPDA